VAIPRVEKFKYFGSITEEKGDTKNEKDINQHIKLGYQK